MTLRVTLTALLLCIPTAFAQAPDPCATAPQSCATLIQTHATSQARLPNTAVDVFVGLSASGKDLVETQRNLAAKSSSLVAYLRTQQVQRLITARVSFAPDTKYERSGPEKTVGYSGSSRISFRTTPDKLADLLAGVLSNGANSIESTTFTPTEEEIAKARRELSADATKTAVAQAESIANAAGMKVVSIRNIAVDTDSSPTFQTSQLEVNGMMGYADKLRAPQPVETASGDEQLSIRVNITAAASR